LYWAAQNVSTTRALVSRLPRKKWKQTLSEWVEGDCLELTRGRRMPGIG